VMARRTPMRALPTPPASRSRRKAPVPERAGRFPARGGGHGQGMPQV
jgi:hypothetical protein